MEAISWQDEAACREKPRDLFFDAYENGSVAKRESIKNICKRNCPVKDQCLAFGKATRSTGVFGGEYLKQGKPYHGLIFS